MILCRREYARIANHPMTRVYENLDNDPDERAAAVIEVIGYADDEFDVSPGVALSNGEPMDYMYTATLSDAVKYLMGYNVNPSMIWIARNRDDVVGLYASQKMSVDNVYAKMFVAVALRELSLESDLAVFNPAVAYARTRSIFSTRLLADVYELTYQAIQNRDNFATAMLDNGWDLRGLTYAERKREILEFNESNDGISEAAYILLQGTGRLADPRNLRVQAVMKNNEIQPTLSPRVIALMMLRYTDNGGYELPRSFLYEAARLSDMGIFDELVAKAVVSNNVHDWDDVTKAISQIINDDGTYPVELVEELLGVG